MPPGIYLFKTPVLSSGQHFPSKLFKIVILINHLKYIKSKLKYSKLSSDLLSFIFRTLSSIENFTTEDFPDEYGRLWGRIWAAFGNRFIFSAEVHPEKSGLSLGSCYKKQLSLKNAATSCKQRSSSQFYSLSRFHYWQSHFATMFFAFRCKM